MITNIINSTTVDGSPWKDQTAHWIAMAIIRVKSRIAHCLQLWERKFTSAEKKVLLIFFCVLSGGYCLCLLGSALSGHAPSHHYGIQPAVHLSIVSPPPGTSVQRFYVDTLVDKQPPASNSTDHKNKLR